MKHLDLLPGLFFSPFSPLSFCFSFAVAWVGPRESTCFRSRDALQQIAFFPSFSPSSIAAYLACSRRRARGLVVRVRDGTGSVFLFFPPPFPFFFSLNPCLAGVNPPCSARVGGRERILFSLFFLSIGTDLSVTETWHLLASQVPFFFGW